MSPQVSLEPSRTANPRPANYELGIAPGTFRAIVEDGTALDVATIGEACAIVIENHDLSGARGTVVDSKGDVIWAEPH